MNKQEVLAMETLKPENQSPAQEERLLSLSRGSALPLRQKAYEEIKRRIITMEYRPGKYLNESLVSKALGMGRTPVHQALLQLQLEELLDIIPRKGLIVRPISVHEISNITDVRAANEALCVSLAARWADAKDIRSLREILDRAKELVPLRDIEALMNLDHEFHCEISRISRNPVLGNILRSLHERSLRFWFLSLSTLKNLEDVHAEHEAIYAAIAAHDFGKAEEAARFHIEQFRKNILLSI